MDDYRPNTLLQAMEAAGGELAIGLEVVRLAMEATGDLGSY